MIFRHLSNKKGWADLPWLDLLQWVSLWDMLWSLASLQQTKTEKKNGIKQTLAPLNSPRRDASNDVQHTFDLVLDLRSTFQLTCNVMMCSLRPAEIHTMVGELFLHLQYLKSYWSKAHWMCNDSLKFENILEPKPLTWGQIWLHVAERAFQEESITFLHVSSYNSSWATVSYLEHYFEVKIWQPTQLSDVTVTWPDLAHIWNFAHLYARYSFEAIRNFAFF